MRDDVVYIPASIVQRFSRGLVFRIVGQFLFPPGLVVDSKGRTFGVEHMELLEEPGIVRLQDAALNIVAATPAHSKDPFTAQFKYLTALHRSTEGWMQRNLQAVSIH